MVEVLTMPNNVIDTLRESLNRVAKGLGISLDNLQQPYSSPPRLSPPSPPPPPLHLQQGQSITREDVIQILVSNGYYLEPDQINRVLSWANGSGVRKDDLLDDIILGFVDGCYFPIINRRKK
jgi:hypothetical protein